MSQDAVLPPSCCRSTLKITKLYYAKMLILARKRLILVCPSGESDIRKPRSMPSLLSAILSLWPRRRDDREAPSCLEISSLIKLHLMRFLCAGKQLGNAHGLFPGSKSKPQSDEDDEHGTSRQQRRPCPLLYFTSNYK